MNKIRELISKAEHSLKYSDSRPLFEMDVLLSIAYSALAIAQLLADVEFNEEKANRRRNK